MQFKQAILVFVLEFKIIIYLTYPPTENIAYNIRPLLTELRLTGGHLPRGGKFEM